MGGEMFFGQLHEAEHHAHNLRTAGAVNARVGRRPFPLLRKRFCAARLSRSKRDASLTQIWRPTYSGGTE
jgi:hypothetical protein